MAFPLPPLNLNLREDSTQSTAPQDAMASAAAYGGSYSKDGWVVNYGGPQTASTTTTKTAPSAEGLPLMAAGGASGASLGIPPAAWLLIGAVVLVRLVKKG